MYWYFFSRKGSEYSFHHCTVVSDSQVSVTVTLQGAGLLQVTSDLFQVLYLCLQRLNMTARENVQPQKRPNKQRLSQSVNQLVRLLDSCVLPRGQCAACGPSRPAETDRVLYHTSLWH